MTGRESGFYWYREPGKPWTVVELRRWGGKIEEVAFIATEIEELPENLIGEWGPRIEPPPE